MPLRTFLVARLCLLAAGLWLPSAGAAGAQPLGAAPAARRLELGGSRLSIRRAFRYDDGLRQTLDWGRRAAFVRIGLTDWLCLTGDGGIGHTGAADDFPERDYWDVSAGVGAAAALVRRGPTRLSAAARFHMYAMLDASDERYSKRTSHLTAAVLLERRLGATRWGADLWAGPAYVRDRITQLPPFGAADAARSQENWGAVVGGGVRVARRLRGFGQWTYAGFWQPELGASILF